MIRWWRTRPDGRRRPTVALVVAVVLALAWWLGGRSTSTSAALPSWQEVGARPEPAVVDSGRTERRTADWQRLLEETLRPVAGSGMAAEPVAPLVAPLAMPPRWEGGLIAMAVAGGELTKPTGTVRLPAGERIRVWFLDTVRSGHFPALVRWMVAEDVRFGGRVVLPRGVRLHGRIAGEAGDRLALEVGEIQWPDGRVEPLAGQLTDLADGFAGVRASVVPPPAWVQGLGLAEEAWAAGVGVLRARAEGNVRDPWMTRGPDWRDTMTDAASQAALAAGRQQAGDWRRRFPGYLEVPPGTEAWVVLLSPWREPVAPAEPSFSP